eukprot:g29405.t1
MGAQLQACGRICWRDPPRDARTTHSSKGCWEDEWAKSRVKGTPISDEGFICMGSKAPICPTSAAIVREGWSSSSSLLSEQEYRDAGPINLSVLQGSWLGSGGAKITVTGTEVSINGLPLKAHKVELNDDGLVVSIGKLWQLQGWASNGAIEFRASSTRENMETRPQQCHAMQLFS